jgi:hypothetical protein
MEDTLTEATVEQPAVYTDIYQAPKHMRIYRSARLSLDQINALIADAYKNMLLPKEGERDTAIPDFGGAKMRFEQSHEIQNGFWVIKKEGEAN